MKKLIMLLLSLLLIAGCTKEKKIEINQINTGYEANNITTINNIPRNTWLWSNVNYDENFIAIIKYDETDKVIGYSIYDPDTNNVTESSAAEPPEFEHEEYGWLAFQNDECSIYYKVISDYVNQMTNYKYYVEKDGNFSLLHENSQSVFVINDYLHSYLYIDEDTGYLVKKENDDLTVNEISSNELIKVNVIHTEYDEFKLTNYYYDNALILNYSSENGNLLKIDDEEYELESNSEYILFNDIILVSVYNELENQNIQEITNSYAIDRDTKELYTLDLKIDTKNWSKYNDTCYYAYNGDGNLMFLTYNGDINVITTSINKYSVDKQKIVTVKDIGIFVLNYDYEQECVNFQLITLDY